MPVYKASCVILGTDSPGTILNLNEAPKPGNTIQLGKKNYIIIETLELTPPRGDFHFVHVTLKPTNSDH